MEKIILWKSGSVARLLGSLSFAKATEDLKNRLKEHTNGLVKSTKSEKILVLKRDDLLYEALCEVENSRGVTIHIDETNASSFFYNDNLDLQPNLLTLQFDSPSCTKELHK